MSAKKSKNNKFATILSISMPTMIILLAAIITIAATSNDVRSPGIAEISEINNIYNDNNNDLNSGLNNARIAPAPRPSAEMTPHHNVSLQGNAAVDAFFAGNGTDGLSWESAYVFQNKNISNYIGTGFLLNNSNRHIIIKNCFFQNLSLVLKFVNSSNLRTTDFYVLNCGVGLYMANCANTEFTNWIYEGFEGGFEYGVGLFAFMNTTNILVDGVSMQSDDIWGIGITADNCTDIIIKNSKFDCLSDALYFSTDSAKNLVLFNNTFFGRCYFNNYPFDIENASILYNDFRCRVDFETAKDTIIRNNIFNFSVSPSRIRFYVGSTNTYVFNNSFINDIDNPDYTIEDNSAGGVVWFDESTKSGNYWFNYTTLYPSATNNGKFWSDPYEVIAGSGIYDDYPLIDAKINRPALGAAFLREGAFRLGGSGVISIHPKGEAFFGIKYTLMLDSQTIVSEGERFETADPIIFAIDGLAIGAHTLKIELNNPEFGEAAAAIYEFFITEPYPSKPIIATESSTISTLSMTLVWNATEYADNYTIYINGIENATVEGLVATITFPNNGTYYISISAANEQGASELSDMIVIVVRVELSGGANTGLPSWAAIALSAGGGGLLIGAAAYVSLRKK